MKIVLNAELAHHKMRNKKLKIFIIAGEVSGDVLGAKIMREMPDVAFVGVGGENMAHAGLKSLFPMSDLAVMGAVEVLANARTLTHRIRQTVDTIIKTQPDFVLTIDSPGFARSVIGKLRKLRAGQKLISNGLRFHHVVAPQVWAWRPRRAKKYAQTFDKLYAFFDFELPYFTKYGLDTMAVGHPISDGLVGRKYTGDDGNLITVIPGSRMSEVKRLMPILCKVVESVHNKNPEYEFVIPTVETTREYIANAIKNWNVPVKIVDSSERYDLYSKAFIAIAASGTVSAELAMIHVPAIIVYKMNPITVWLARQFIRVKWVSLVNILLNRGVYPELLGADATAENIMVEFSKLTNGTTRKEMIHELGCADKLWRRSADTPAGIIAKDLVSGK